jgi:hypothetical protein
VFPIFSNASLDGAKMVASFSPSTAVTRLVFVRPPASDVSLESMAVMDGEIGIVRTVSMMCMTPPLNIISFLSVSLSSFSRGET